MEFRQVGNWHKNLVAITAALPYSSDIQYTHVSGSYYYYQCSYYLFYQKSGPWMAYFSPDVYILLIHQLISLIETLIIPSPR